MKQEREGRLGQPVAGIPHGVELVEGQVWRKFGPGDWWRVRSICLPGFPAFDGGAPGVFVDTRTDGGRWRTRPGTGWFVPVESVEGFITWMVSSFRFPEEEAEVRCPALERAHELYRKRAPLQDKLADELLEIINSADDLLDAQLGAAVLREQIQDLEDEEAVYDRMARAWPLWDPDNEERLV